LTDTTRIGGRRLSPSRVSHPEHRRSGWSGPTPPRWR